VLNFLKNKSKFIIIKMKATIVTIGDEILIGQIVDTNSALPNLG
jgi:nicotinamide-nucleotide amidase